MQHQIKLDKNNISADDIIDLVGIARKIHHVDYNSESEIATIFYEENATILDPVEIIPNILTKMKVVNGVGKLKVHMIYTIDLMKFQKACYFISSLCPYIVEYFLEETPELNLEFNTIFERTQTNNEIAGKVEKFNLVQIAFKNIEMLEPLVFVAMVMKFYQQKEFKRFNINGAKQINIIFKEFNYINQLFINPAPILSTYKIDFYYSNSIIKVGNLKSFGFADQEILTSNNFNLYQNLPELKLIDYIANR